ncbi:GNAT family N-acetyltransferase [Halotalea alkalilenta]|uniref:GNAT family N-acetyltransferase n=1 Tax=Halotalea alkalilenta TaxID=376489 RepID=UPI0006938C7E|nr:GNAT family N-acetyltransferase [Halotalea alkalilenta]
MSPPALLRLMRETDLPAVLRLQAACYHELEPESQATLESKRAASTRSCWVAERDGQALAYLFTLPWRFDAPPALDARCEGLPLAPDTLYVHDLAIAPEARGQGIGERLVEAALAFGRAEGLERSSLIAVQGAQRYWCRHGYRPLDPLSATIAARLESYPSGACYMWRTL